MSRPPTDRESSLLRYFHLISTDPRVKAATDTLSVTGLRDAVYACLAEDLPAVMKQVGLRAAEMAAPIASTFVRGAVDAALDGLPPSLRKHAGGAIEDLIADGINHLRRPRRSSRA